MISLLAVLVLGASPSDLDFDAVVKEASAANTPIVVDVYTAWCKPCTRLEQEVFPQPKVAAALSKVRFIRYDAERGKGVAFAERLAIHSYPSILVFTPDGVLAGQIHTQAVDAFAAEVTSLSAVASVKGPFTDEVLARQDVDARVAYLVGLKLQREAPRAPARAIAAFDRAVARDPDGALGVRALALPLAARARYKASLSGLKAKALLELAQLTGTATATAALGTLASHEGAFDAKQARQAAQANRVFFTAHKNADGLNQLIYSQLALLDIDGALESAKALEALKPLPGMMDTVAEAYFQANQKEKALELEAAAVKAEPTSELKANLHRFETEEPAPPPYSGPDPLAEDHVPGEGGGPPAYFLESLQLSATLIDACKAVAGKTRTTYVRLTFAGTAVTRAVAFDLEAPAALRKCLESAARSKSVKELGAHSPWDLELRFSGSP